jgi:hypothetical protein
VTSVLKPRATSAKIAKSGAAKGSWRISVGTILAIAVAWELVPRLLEDRTLFPTLSTPWSDSADWSVVGTGGAT